MGVSDGFGCHLVRWDLEPVGCHPCHHRGRTAARRPGLYGGSRNSPGQPCTALCWKDADGNKLWVHCASGTGVVLNSPDYVTQYRRRNDIDLEGDLVPAAIDAEEAGASG